VIELRGVSVRLGATQALRGVSFTAERGSWVSLIGPNGAGKTTAIRALCGLVSYEGEVLVDGVDARARGRRELARLCAFVPQLPETPPETTRALFDMFCALNGTTSMPRRRNARASAVVTTLLPAELDAPCTMSALIVVGAGRTRGLRPR
jgi:ABC-type multidrug transport system ATPase subunit